MKMNKKAYYFTLDAFIAIVILASGFLLIRSTYITVPMSSTVEHISDDVLDLLSTAKAKEFGIITKNSDNTLLEAIGEGHYIGIIPNIDDFIINNKIIPDDHGASIFIETKEIYSKDTEYI